MDLSRRQAAAGLIALPAAAPLSRAFAQTVAPANPSPNLAEPPTEIGAGHDAYEHMLAPVTVNGQGPFQFLMDTGANTSCVSRDLADRLMLAATDPARIHTVVGVHERPQVIIDRLQVGERSRKAVRAATLPLNKGLDGVLGVDWLDGQRLVLAFKDRNISIARSVRDIAADGSVIVPARRRMGQLTIVDADLGGRPISAMIDSGSQMSMANTPLRALVAAQNRRSGASDTYHQIGMETLAGEPFFGEMLYLPFLRLGGLQLGNVPVVHANVHVFDLWGLKDKPAIVLGMDLLSQFERVSLDFGRSQVRFDLAAGQFTPSSPLVRPA
ncbi:retroviral-like aspartic protease family protein [Phenylobacterium sp.]|jgi:predicted aspartyl protease|uniref:retroviral-like aspartic protease family protein n=1 Tax=Phenylobacterium sp. TaxID=1871053 RepID=UPI002E364C0E|nr:retroviral-like aspartic protease family protein [Phenylobacterium sp.]HEX3364366.1 retroviral-like aspartic protease family protein [Phenylobacterium sp.]